MTTQRIILAYSGGRTSAAAIAWLRDRFKGAEIIAVLVDLGARAELVEARERALSLGVVRCHVLDAREAFVRRYILPALQAGALADGRSPCLAALSRAAIARAVVDLAQMESATAIACGAARADDHRSFQTLIHTLNPALEVIPFVQPVPHNLVANVWGRSIVHESLDQERSEDIYTLTRPPESGPDQPAYIDIEFTAGVPVRVNGIEMLLLEMIESLETIAGAHGVGRIDAALARPDGTRCRETAEVPAGVLLQKAHSELQELAITRELAHLLPVAAASYRGVLEGGRWFSDVRTALDAFIASIQPKVSGSIRLRLFKGDCRVVGRRLHHSGQTISGTPLVRTV